MELFLILNWTINEDLCEVDRDRMDTLNISAPVALGDFAIVPPDKVKKT